MDIKTNLLVRAVVEPRSLAALDAGQWDRLLPMARQAGLLARIGIQLEAMGLIEGLLPKVREHLAVAQVVAGEQQRVMWWEINRLQRALGGMGVPVLLLKGAAYLVAKLPNAPGRLSTDIDIMVPKAQLKKVEQTLLDHGWAHIKLDPYDQRYYRAWMHELPPLQHSRRRTVVDVHHNILPETGRLHPDPELLFTTARRVDGVAFQTLAPCEMVLHCAAHLFQDGDLNNGLRDLVDLDDLLRHFGGTQGFWDQLVPSAEQLDLVRPLFYALRYTQRILGTPIPDAVSKQAAGVGAPPRAVMWVMDRLVNRALTTEYPRLASWRTGLARWLLYVRSHWLRMPPWLLARHLLRKSRGAPSTPTSQPPSS